MSKIRSNLSSLRRYGVPLMLMLKADAYGHGLERVAQSVQDVADAFGVATFEEGAALRRIGIKSEVLVLCASADEVKGVLKEGLTLGLYDFSQLSALERLKAEGFDLGLASIHVKVDSGMRRLGFMREQLSEVLGRLMDLGSDVKGVYSHMRCPSRLQKEEFDRCAEMVRQEYPHAVRHLASSRSISNEAFRYDLVRVGFAAYEGAAEVYGKVLSSRAVKAGEFVGYGRCRAKRDCIVATVFGGYADGADRERPSSVYIRGVRCPVIGRACMDVVMVDVGDMDVKSGEEALLLSAGIAREVAKERKTTEYTLMTAFRGRVKRIYVEDGGEEAREGADGAHDG